MNNAQHRVLPALTGLLLVAACQPVQQPEQVPPPFVFRTLELRQKDGRGLPSWEITSPEARYDLGRKLATARSLRGLIYAKGKPLYRLTASRGLVINDGEVVQLEGPSRLERLGPNPLVITALRVRWYPRAGRMLLDRQPRATQKQLELTARRAVFDVGQDKLLLSGDPLLVDQGRPRLSLALRQVQWWAASGTLMGAGPVRGERRESGGRHQTLTSPSLSGNSLRQELILAAPVRVVDAADGSELRARASRIDLAQETISSDQPFEGQRGSLTLRGQGFTLSSRSTTLVIPRGCELRQPGDQLLATRCSWNWSTDQVEARGGVELRRQQNGQVTRAEQLDGRAAKDGSVVFSQPGGRVTSQFSLPPAARSGPGAPRRSSPPIQL